MFLLSSVTWSTYDIFLVEWDKFTSMGKYMVVYLKAKKTWKMSKKEKSIDLVCMFIFSIQNQI